MTMKLRHLDLFSGIGGFSLGLERTGGFQTVAFCDSDKKTHLVLKKHWPNVPIFDDVSTLKGKDLGTVEIITGGFPCQDLSVAGKGAGLAGARSGLWWQFHRLIEETQPKYVIAENVAVLRSRGLDQVLRSLHQIGYDAEWHCIPASAVGAPHQRDRIWIVAYPNGDDRRSGSSAEPHQRQAWMESRRSGERFSERETEQTLAYSNGSVETNGGKCSIPTQQSDGGRIGQAGGGTDDRERCFRSSGKGSEDDMAYSGGEGLEGFGIRTIGTEQKESLPTRSGCIVRAINKSDFWEVEPQLGRVANGIPNRVDRLKQLGNSLVPQIPELIGYAILQKEQLK
jgi:DNA (cytosine-5)-methyltransferase 1